MDDLLAHIAADQAKAGEASQPPASDVQVADLANAVRATFGAALPDAFVYFLKRANGLDYNGLVLYGAGQSEAEPSAGGFWQGLVETNRLWRESADRETYLVLGDTDMDLLTVDLDGTNPCLRDKIAGDVVETFDTLEQTVIACLRQRLN